MDLKKVRVTNVIAIGSVLEKTFTVLCGTVSIPEKSFIITAQEAFATDIGR